MFSRADLSSGSARAALTGAQQEASPLRSSVTGFAEADSSSPAPASGWFFATANKYGACIDTMSRNRFGIVLDDVEMKKRDGRGKALILVKKWRRRRESNPRPAL